MSDFESCLSHYLNTLEYSRVCEAMQYSLIADDKRICPRLLLAVLHAYGFEGTIGHPVAVVIGMIHTHLLTHDDLPAMDNGALCKGMPTCHVKFGEDVIILVGDALLTQAFYTAAACICRTEILVEILKLLSRFSGVNGMILGQVKDLEGETNPGIDHVGLQVIHCYKTGGLLGLPPVCAVLLTRHREDAAIWERTGTDTGSPFRTQDDTLDVTSITEELGKNISSDTGDERTTYITLIGAEVAREEVDHYYRRALAQLDVLSLNVVPVGELSDQLMKRKS